MSSCSHVWIDQLSLDRYRPMLRLLSSGDIDFLRACPGSTPRQIRNLRARRVRILRDYLRSLSADFHCICLETRGLVVHSEVDRFALALELLRREWQFARNLAVLRVRLVFYRWGLAQVNPGSLLSLFDAARLRLRDLAP